MKSRENIFLSVILTILVVGLVGYIICDKLSELGTPETENNVVTEKEDEIKSYLIYTNEFGKSNIIDDTHGIKVETIPNDSVGYMYKILHNGNLLKEVSYLKRIYLIGDIVLYTTASSENGEFGFVDLNGKQLEDGIDRKELNSSIIAIYNSKYELIVDDNIIYIPTFYGEYDNSCVDSKNGVEVYKIEYLGNNKFSKLTKVMSKVRDCRYINGEVVFED